jgi:uncharacterized protein (TIGR03067 family)
MMRAFSREEKEESFPETVPATFSACIFSCPDMDEPRQYHLGASGKCCSFSIAGGIMSLYFLAVLLLSPSVLDAPAAEDASKKDLKQLQGVWKVKELQSISDEANEIGKHMRIVIEGNKFTTLVVEEASTETFTLDARKTPKVIDITQTLPQVYAKGEKPPPKKQQIVPGIYTLTGSTLKICLSEPGMARPAEFSGGGKSRNTLLVLERDSSSSTKTRLNELAELSEIRKLGANAFYAGDGSLERQQLYVVLGETKGDKDIERLAPHLKKLSKITGLHLHDSKVTDAGLAHLKGMDNIGHINLSKTKTTDAGLKNLKGMAHLEFLIVNGTQVTDAGIKALKQMLPKLEVEKLTAAQELANDEINKAGGILFTGNGRLLKVRFAGGRLEDADIAGLKKHLEVWKDTLNDLDLSKSKITDAGLEHLKGLTSLKRLKLRGTGITDGGIASLKKALPKLKVEQ